MTDLEAEAWVRANEWRIQRDADQGNRAAQNVLMFRRRAVESADVSVWAMFLGAIEDYQSRSAKRKRRRP